MIAIIGILVSLLLPAVQAAREAGRRASCSNNMHQLAIAMHNYNDIYTALPICYSGDGTASETDWGKGWMVGILPFIEQDTLHKKIRWTPAPSGTSHTLGSPENQAVATVTIKSFVCISDGNNGRGAMSGRANVNPATIYGVTNYKACAGANWCTADPSTGAITGQWSSAGAQVTEDVKAAPFPNNGNGLDAGNGIICRNGSNNPALWHELAFVTDGLSNTFAVGEAVPAWCTHTTWWGWNHSTATCGIPLNYKPPAVLNGTQTMEENAADYLNNYSFMSRHPNGAQFAMCDGAVKYITDSVDFTVYKRLATAAGNRAAQVP
ncbi:MAG TPA: DUF1559 domain-containing protein [Pirellulaceae bacterium]|nr:DUF1559 domain-containing protein [Pirellulaceae bacterium]